ncbi:MAG: hypothetical protein WCY63_10545, partial [Weeksellaceae bacterium]
MNSTITFWKSKFLITQFLSLIFICSGVLLSAQTVFYSENFGTPSGNVAIGSYTGFQNTEVTYSGSADIRSSTPSSGYSGASGGGNVFFNLGRTFLIEGIDASGYSNLELSFGHHKANNASGAELTVQVSYDGGGIWHDLTYVRETGSGTTRWTFIVPEGLIENPSSLSILFINTANTNNYHFRLDDIKLSGIPSACEVRPDVPAGVIEGVPFYCETGNLHWNGDAAPEGITYYWQSEFYGTDTNYPVSADLQVSESGTYYVRAKRDAEDCWSATSEGFEVGIGGNVEIIEYLQDQTVQIGDAATFTVIDEGGAYYQWQKFSSITNSWSDVISFSFENSYTIPNVTADMNGTSYRVLVYDACGTVAQNPAPGFAMLNVIPQEEKTFRLITSTDELEPGLTYLIMNKGEAGLEGSYSIGIQETNNRKPSPEIQISLIDGKLQIEDLILALFADDDNRPYGFELGGNAGAWTFYDAAYSGYLYAAGGGSNNYLRVRPENSDGNSQWAITFNSNGSADIKAQGSANSNWLRYNSTSNIFSVYTGGQQNVYLYKELNTCSGIPAGGTVSITPESGLPDSEYTVSATDYAQGEGITYMWQSKTDEGEWINETEATQIYSDFTATAPEEGSVVEWRLAVSCSASGETAYSTTADFTSEVNFCSGTPEAGTVSITPSTGAPGSAYTVSASDYSEGEAGLSYQWEFSLDNGTTWEEFGVAAEVYEDAEATAPDAFSSQVFWRLKVSCSESESFAVSEEYSVFTVNDESTPEISCFTEDFSSLTAGHSNSSDGSGTQWSGNDNFPTVERAYQAGGAVKLGTSSAIGFIESKELNEVEGNITVNIMVKGWTAVEGNLLVSIDGQSQTLTYSAVMTGNFEEVTANFTNVSIGAKLKIETTSKRAFVDNVEIICEDGSEPTPCPELLEAPANVTFDDSVCQEGCEVSGGVIFAPGETAPEGAHIEYSTDGGATWSTELPVYNQTESMSIITRFVCNSDASVVSPSSEAVTTMPDVCETPETIPEITITNNICPSTDGSISASESEDGYTIEWATNPSGPWTTSAPTYTQTAMTVYARYVNENGCAGEMASEMTSPDNCAVTGDACF